MAVDLRSKIVAEFAKRGWTLARLIAEAGLSCAASTLHRKLYGFRKAGAKRGGSRTYLTITVDEYRRLGLALNVLDDDDAARLDQLAADLGALGARGVA